MKKRLLYLEPRLQLGALGRTVVCTIHQPSIDIFDAFDEVRYLSNGGEEIYASPLEHHSAHLIRYFEVRSINTRDSRYSPYLPLVTGISHVLKGIDGVSKIKDGYNSATWMLEVTSAAQEAALGINFTDVYKNSELYSTTLDPCFYEYDLMFVFSRAQLGVCVLKNIVY
uniref:ABC transporter family G domain-containing protein n=1 Tax=Vitis vinifera TaxID=29760 RepID=F6H002_VITVI